MVTRDEHIDGMAERTIHLLDGRVGRYEYNYKRELLCNCLVLKGR